MPSSLRQAARALARGAAIARAARPSSDTPTSRRPDLARRGSRGSRASLGRRKPPANAPARGIRTLSAALAPPLRARITPLRLRRGRGRNRGRRRFGHQRPPEQSPAGAGRASEPAAADARRDHARARDGRAPHRRGGGDEAKRPGVRGRVSSAPGRLRGCGGGGRLGRRLRDRRRERELGPLGRHARHGHVRAGAEYPRPDIGGVVAVARTRTPPTRRPAGKARTTRTWAGARRFFCGHRRLRRRTRFVTIRWRPCRAPRTRPRRRATTRTTRTTRSSRRRRTRSSRRSRICCA